VTRKLENKRHRSIARPDPTRKNLLEKSWSRSRETGPLRICSLLLAGLILSGCAPLKTAGRASPSAITIPPSELISRTRQLARPALSPAAQCTSTGMTISSVGTTDYVSAVVVTDSCAPAYYGVSWQTSNDMNSWQPPSPAVGGTTFRYNTSVYPTQTLSTWFPTDGQIQKFYRLALTP
jgi:hypothetical protein